MRNNSHGARWSSLKARVRRMSDTLGTHGRGVVGLLVPCVLQSSAFCQNSGIPISYFGECLKLDPISCCDWVSEYHTLPAHIPCCESSCMPLINSQLTNRWQVGAPGHRNLITMPNKSCTVWAPVCIEAPTGSPQCALEIDPVIYVCSDCAVPVGAMPCGK